MFLLKLWILVRIILTYILLSFEGVIVCLVLRLLKDLHVINFLKFSPKETRAFMTSNGQIRLSLVTPFP